MTESLNKIVCMLLQSANGTDGQSRFIASIFAEASANPAQNLAARQCVSHLPKGYKQINLMSSIAID